MSLSANRIVDPVLTTLARGFSQPSFVGTSLFPIVNVEKEGGKIPLFGKEAFKVYKTERAIRSQSNRISPEGITSVDFVLDEHDLEYPMDEREIKEDVRNLRLHATKTTVNGIQLRLEKKIADLAQNLASYPTGNKLSVASGDKFTASTSNPIALLESAKEAVRAKIALRPNTMVMGAASYSALKNHPAILERIKFTQHAIITPDLLRSLLEIDQLFIGEAVYSNDDGSTFTDVWGDNVILAYIPKAASSMERSFYEPSFAYTLRKNNYPVVDSYIEPGNKVQVVRTTDIFIPKIVGSDAGYLIKGTN